MEREQFIKFAWWNARLSHPGNVGKARDPAQFSKAKEVVRALFDNEGIDLLALGEITPDEAYELCPPDNSDRTLEVIIPSAPNSSAEVDMNMIFDSNKIRRKEYQVQRSSIMGKSEVSGLFASFEDDQSEVLHFFSVHWPSRRYDQEGVKRSKYASSLRHTLDQYSADSLLIVLGDFNDEPHDDSVSIDLLSSRDRKLVRQRPGMLYNPFWRQLGERHTLSSENELQLGAGTCFFQSGLLSRWYTLDQILFSSAFLGRSRWTLLEEEVGIWQAEPLLTKSGRLAKGFDHFPVIGALHCQRTEETETDNG